MHKIGDGHHGVRGEQDFLLLVIHADHVGRMARRMPHDQRGPAQPHRGLLFHQDRGHDQAHIGQDGIKRSGLQQGGFCLGEQQFPGVKVPDDLGFGEEIRTVHMISVGMRQDDVFDLGAQSSLHEIRDLLGLFRIRQGVDQDATLGRADQSGIHPGVHAAAKYVGVFGNAFSQDHGSITPAFGIRKSDDKT